MSPALDSQRAMDAPDIRTLFEQHHGEIVQAAYRITGRAEDAEDVLQTIFMRLVKRSGQPISMEVSRSYFRKAAVNAALDIMRSRNPARRIPLDDVSDRLAGENGADLSSRRRELQEGLRQALAQLNARAAEMFVLRFIEGCSNQEIAELLGTTPGTVAVTLHRARTQLREALALTIGREGL